MRKATTMEVLASAGAMTGALALGAVSGPASADESPRDLGGVWQVQVQPDGAPTAFASTLAYVDGGVVVETTSKAPMAAGVGSWTRVRPGQYAVHFSKYRFTPQGAFAGTTVVDEVTTVTDAHTYEGRATTTLYDAAGAVQATFSSTSHGTR